MTPSAVSSSGRPIGLPASGRVTRKRLPAPGLLCTSMAAMVGDDAEAGGQPHAGALADRAGSEEGSKMRGMSADGCRSRCRQSRTTASNPRPVRWRW